MSIPQIQIKQQMAQIGMSAERGKLKLEQPEASIKMKQVNAELQISHTDGRLEINQDKAWDALGLASPTTVMNRIYTQAKSIALNGIARRMQDGDRLGNIAQSQGNNPIPSMAKDWRDKKTNFNVSGPASYLNVHVNYSEGQLSIDSKEGYVDRTVEVNSPINRSTIGQLDIYMRQRASVEITPPQINTTF
ncbi:hypothetical protein BK133_10315 [Paenibacillus sp. FSL H8-0548]|uniref:DUF6470 family protein n=1 Tax=Paenibacillus sp. FSL H8-0548 TaxID=1920422 RepID=UPI00096F5424|nr:DUF6470 family protein [Paenibacillus sp. FSL H8-0548]OMF35835.1 hypothetical protein BK133_10315 [Paenibacillus sp. FSL H8-0548]